MITPAQIRAARALIGWKQSDLAQAAGVSEISIKNIERGVTDPRTSTVLAIRNALARGGAICFAAGEPPPYGGAGVIFVAENGDGTGVRLRKTR